MQLTEMLASKRVFWNRRLQMQSLTAADRQPSQLQRLSMMWKKPLSSLLWLRARHIQYPLWMPAVVTQLMASPRQQQRPLHCHVRQQNIRLLAIQHGTMPLFGTRSLMQMATSMLRSQQLLS